MEIMERSNKRLRKGRCGFKVFCNVVRLSRFPDISESYPDFSRNFQILRIFGCCLTTLTVSKSATEREVVNGGFRRNLDYNIVQALLLTYSAC